MVASGSAPTLRRSTGRSNLWGLRTHRVHDPLPAAIAQTFVDELKIRKRNSMVAVSVLLV
jgi:hypothetical protein